MAEMSMTRLFLMRAAFLFLALVVLFFHLLPLNTLPSRWAPPDVLLAFVMAWSLRRPDYVPAWVIAIAMLVADLLLQRPPGLMAALTVMGSEYLKNRSAGLREAGFLAEWAAVALVIAMILLADRLILILVAVPPAPLGLSLIQMVLTLAVYPVVVFFTQSVLGVRRPARGSESRIGGRA